MDALATHEQFDYIPATRERNWGMYVTGAGRHVEPPRGTRHARVPLGRDQNGKGRVLHDYALVYVTDGNGAFRVHDDSAWRRVSAGDVFVLFPGIRHDYHLSLETGWTERWVLFNGDQANRWCMYDVLCVDLPVLHVGVHDEIIERFDRLLEVARANPPFTNQIQSGIAMEILAVILKFNQDRNKNSKTTAPIVKLALQFIGKNWSQEIDFQAMAVKLGVGYRNFRRMFQQATGLAPHQYLLNLRLNQAKRLLATLPVSEVAARVGFPDPLYFSRIFKKKVGIAPSRWH